VKPAQDVADRELARGTQPREISATRITVASRSATATLDATPGLSLPIPFWLLLGLSRLIAARAAHRVRQEGVASWRWPG